MRQRSKHEPHWVIVCLTASRPHAPNPYLAPQNGTLSPLAS